MEKTMREYEDMYKNPRALGSPKKEKKPRPENDMLQDGHERESTGYCWLDERRKRGGGGGRSFG